MNIDPNNPIALVPPRDVVSLESNGEGGKKLDKILAISFGRQVIAHVEQHQQKRLAGNVQFVDRSIDITR